MSAIITLTTDFGLKDQYAGAMKGAILSVNPAAGLIDISHSVPAGDILHGAFVMAEACGFFPPGTVHLGVVDPGVGGPRRAVIVETERFLFVGPDNGLLGLMAEGDGVKRIFEIKNERYMRKAISRTFHGRDIFGPVAGHLSLGVAPEEFGPETRELDMISLRPPECVDGAINGEVIYIDSYGNIITNIGAEFIESCLGTSEIELTINGRRVKGLYPSYASLGKGELGALTGSSGRVEVAADEANGAEALCAVIGDKVRIEKR